MGVEWVGPTGGVGCRAGRSDLPVGGTGKGVVPSRRKVPGASSKIETRLPWLLPYSHGPTRPRNRPSWSNVPSVTHPVRRPRLPCTHRPGTATVVPSPSRPGLVGLRSPPGVVPSAPVSGVWGPPREGLRTRRGLPGSSSGMDPGYRRPNSRGRWSRCSIRPCPTRYTFTFCGRRRYIREAHRE